MTVSHHNDHIILKFLCFLGLVWCVEWDLVNLRIKRERYIRKEDVVIWF